MTAPTQTAAMSATRRTYSTSEAPASSRQKARRSRAKVKCGEERAGAGVVVSSMSVAYPSPSGYLPARGSRVGCQIIM